MIPPEQTPLSRRYRSYFYGMLIKPVTALLSCMMLVLGLNACSRLDFQSLQPGVSKADEIRQQFGPPGMTWRNPDDSVVWEYSLQPQGTQCYMLTIGSDGVLRTAEQVLNKDSFARIRPGMTAEEVRRMLGKPAKIQFFDLSQENVWSWHIAADASITDPLYFTVHFDTKERVLKTGLDIKYRGG